MKSYLDLLSPMIRYFLQETKWRNEIWFARNIQHRLSDVLLSIPSPNNVRSDHEFSTASGFRFHFVLVCILWIHNPFWISAKENAKSRILDPWIWISIWNKIHPKICNVRAEKVLFIYLLFFYLLLSVIYLFIINIISSVHYCNLFISRNPLLDDPDLVHSWFSCSSSGHCRYLLQLCRLLPEGKAQTEKVRCISSLSFRSNL